MGLFNFNKTQISSDLTPDNKRGIAGFMQFLYSLIEGVKDSFFLAESVYTGQTPPVTIHDAVTSYSKGDIVQDLASGNVYESLQGFNNYSLDDTTYWRKISDSIIGLKESVNYEGSIISLTYNLNKRYQTLYIADPNVSASDINITLIADGLDMFQVGAREANSSYIAGGNPNTSDGWVTANTTASYQQGFSVNVPAGWWPTYFPTFADCETSIRNYLKTYIPIGLYYEVTDY